MLALYGGNSGPSGMLALHGGNSGPSGTLDLETGRNIIFIPTPEWCVPSTSSA